MGNYYKTILKFSYSPHEAFEKELNILEFLEWTYKSNEPDTIIAYTSLSAFGLGEKITIVFGHDQMHISSESQYPFQLFDLGKNESNVDKFLNIFRRARLPFNESDFADEKPKSIIERYLRGR